MTTFSEATRSDGSRVALTDHVYQYIKGQLLDLGANADDAISVDTVTRALGVSRQPVMGALKRLAIEGLVTIVPQVGCRARRYTIEQAIDFYRLFAEGESLLAYFAATRATSADHIALKIISAQIGELASEARDPGALSRNYRNLNNQFHAELHRIARSPVVARTVEIQRDLSDFFVAQSERPIFGERIATAHTEHEEVLAAVARGDGDAAAAIMRQHVLAITNRLRDR